MLERSQHDAVTRFDLARTLAGRGLYRTTAYWVDGLLVDSGAAHTASQLAAALAEMPLRCIVNTHSHEDHIGGNGLLQRQRSGLEIRAHPLALPVIRRPRQEQPLHPYRRLFWGWPEPSQAGPVQDGESIETGRFRFQVIHTPGHSPDHLCLYEPERGWLFSGDLFVGGRDRALRVDYDIWGIIASLKLVAHLPLTTLFPAGARVREKPADELQAKIDQLEQAGERVLALHQKGWSEQAIARALSGPPMLVELVTLGHFSRRHLVRSFLRASQS